MKYVIFLVLLALAGFTGSSFAEKPISCPFGDQTTESIFENDLAVKAFAQKYPNATRYVVIDETNPPNGELSFTVDNEKEKEILMISFTQIIAILLM